MPALELSSEDHKVLTELRERRILDDIDPHRLEDPSSVVMVSCADGHQMADVFHYQEKICGQNGGPVVHTIALNGGALLIPPDSVVSIGTPDGEVIRRHAIARCAMKGINTLAFYSHAPCGAARTHGLNAVDVISLTLRAKVYMRETLDRENFRMACFVHVDWGSKKRTYFIHKNEFHQWASK